MIIDDLDFEGVIAFPFEADSPLLIDPNAVLAFAFSFERFQAIAWWCREIIQILGVVENSQFTTRRRSVAAESGFVFP